MWPPRSMPKASTLEKRLQLGVEHHRLPVGVHEVDVDLRQRGARPEAEDAVLGVQEDAESGSNQWNHAGQADAEVDDHARRELASDTQANQLPRQARLVHRAVGGALFDVLGDALADVQPNDLFLHTDDAVDINTQGDRTNR